MTTTPQAAEILHLRAQLAEAQSTHDATFAAGVAHGRWLARCDAVRRVAAWREAAPGRDMPRDQMELDAILLGPEAATDAPLLPAAPHIPSPVTPKETDNAVC